MSIRDMRQDYGRHELLESRADADAIRQFARWFDEAVAANHGGELEPNAMTLATVTASGEPAARVVLLKGFDERGFVFFTNYDSAKARHLEAHPLAALVFHWAALERQVRITGAVTKVTRAESEDYFRGRPRGSQLGAWVSRQSRVVADRSELERELAKVQARFAGQDVPAPPNWGGYRVAPASIEFWQGRPDRLHDRLLYTKQPDGSWRRVRLSP